MKRVGEVAKLDTDRERRTGIPEIVLAEGKTDEHLRRIAAEFLAHAPRVLVSRLVPERLPLMRDLGADVHYHADARMCVLARPGAQAPRTGAKVAILTGGTADIAVAEEARIVAEELGAIVTTVYDVGVAGIHRLYPELDRLQETDVFIVAAGREGALPVVVAGLVDKPVIALPVSTGYGKGGLGEAALLTALQSCAPLTTVNIDAGVVAGACAARIANLAAAARVASQDQGSVERPVGPTRRA